jgi:5'-3' exoribonuclease 2
MGGYLTNHGKVNLDRCQYILDGIASQENQIFQKRKADEERQNESQKRRRRDDHQRQDLEELREAKVAKMGKGQMQMNGTDYEMVPSRNESARGGASHPTLPQRPGFDTEVKQPPPRPGKKLTYAQQAASLKAGLEAMSGSNADVVKNRKAIRMANMSAAEKLKAELEGNGDDKEDDKADEETKDGDEEAKEENDDEADAEGDAEGDVSMEDCAPHGKKRKHDEDEDDEENAAGDDDEEAPANPADAVVPKRKITVNPDGTVDYDDNVRCVFT